MMSASHEEILEEATKRAIGGGWKHENQQHYLDYIHSLGISSAEHGKPVFEFFFPMIFNRDFAKALWGNRKLWVHPKFEDGVTNRFRTNALLAREEWQYHLQQMVISEDPIKYLGENL